LWHFKALRWKNDSNNILVSLHFYHQNSSLHIHRSVRTRTPCTI